MKNEISLQKVSARISLGMLLSTLVMGSAWSAEVTSVATGTVTGRAPAMTTGNIESSTPVIGIGSILSMKTEMDKWIFSDADGDTESGTLYVWKDGTDIVSSGVDAAHKSYTIAAKDLGKAFTLYVTPRTDSVTTDPFEGTAVASANSLSVMPANTVLSVAIEGNPVVGTPLTANPTCAATCGPDAEYTYQWKIEGRVAETGAGNAQYADIALATSKVYIPTREQQKLKLQVVVNNKATTTPKEAKEAKAKAKVTQ